MAMPFTDPNAAAAANAGRGLSALADFMYQQQVQKPAAQAQTAATQAQTAYLTGPETSEAQQQIQAQTLANKAALFGQLSQHPIIDTGAINAAVNSAPSTDTSTVTGPVGDGYSGPAPASTSMTPVSNTPAGGTPNQAGSSRQGPDTIATNDDNDYLSPSVTRPGLRPFSDSPARGATSSPAPATSPVSPVPPITSPAAPSSKAGGNFDYRNELSTPFYSLPQPAQNELLSQMRKPFAAAGLPVTDQELIGHYQGLQVQMIPPAMTRTDFVPTTLQDGKVNGVFTSGIDKLGGGNVGNQPSQARIFDPTVGHFIDNPAYQSPDKVAATQGSIDSLNDTQNIVNQTKAAIEKNPSLVGPVTGGKLGTVGRDVKSIFGAPEGAEGESTIKQFKSTMATQLLSQVHLGRMTEVEYNGILNQMPNQTAPKSAWDKFFTDTLQPKLDRAQATAQAQLAAQKGQPASLPPVDVGPSVTPPGGKSSAPSSNAGIISTPEAAAKLASGTWFQTPDGKWRQRK